MTKKSVDIRGYFTGRDGSRDIREHPWLQQMFPSPISKNIPDWFSKQKAKRDEHYTLKICPSFINTFKIGHVLRNPAELTVRGTQDQRGKAMTEVISPLGVNGTHFHTEEHFTDNFPFPVGKARVSYKIGSPFYYRVSRPTNLIILPCWWDVNHNNISAIQGMVRLSPEEDLAFHINTFLRQPQIGEEYVIPYGAPVAHVIVADIPDVCYSLDQKLYDDDIAKQSMSSPKMRDMMGRNRKVFDYLKKFFIRTGSDEN